MFYAHNESINIEKQVCLTDHFLILIKRTRLKFIKSRKRDGN